MAGGGAGYIAAERRQLFANRNYSSLGYCGLTSKDNQGNGCVYDFIIGSWIDSTCHDSKLYAKYVERLRQLNLIYHIDFDGTTEISLDVALRGDHPVIYTTGGHHHLHCSYYWEKQWIAWKYGGTAWDSDTLSDEHTNHCITINGQPRVDELRNGTVIKVSAPEKRIECMTR
ncbi:hypothetical protein HBI56_193890 [Parastagonospora nodorum]|nr:hypothetical protein HBH53_189940 [Parastagonospora nodorum]KAH3962320.1 hypothetical protein HBH51_175840 [Parastagonospora nodorum]KAH3993020.1 hypothetical protein HBI10_207280 [Parastagonospora nodorum]KAH4010896.1 hypothetical protein HBI13_204190 [Parastagonospora nodorum]KAH4019221.1 hypothetical protein HBI09_186580 [Parastagonospora nodorum]